MNNEVSTSWFCVFNNPEEHGYSGSPEEICNQLRDEWIGDSSTRSGAWAYCISEAGLHHVHMVIEDLKPMRFSTIKKEYCKGMHFEPTKGSKRQAEAYIKKEGKFAEKGETIEYMCTHGDIKGKQGRRSDLVDYYERLEAGETVRDILRDTPKAYTHLNVLKNMYYDIRVSNTPIIRDVRVFWHTGPTGSGKSYDRLTLCNELGEDNIYYLTTFNSGCFDRYNGEPVLWIEDFRGEFKLQELLRMLDKYKAEVPARYTNAKALWNEVHITSVLTPCEVYSKATLDDNDRIEQLLRRITSIVYHFKTRDGDFMKLHFPSDMLRVQMENEVAKSKAFFESFAPILTLEEQESAGDSPVGEFPRSEVTK